MPKSKPYTVYHGSIVRANTEYELSEKIRIREADDAYESRQRQEDQRRDDQRREDSVIEERDRRERERQERGY